MLIALVYPVVHFAIAWLTAKLAAHKGYSGGLWFLLSLPLPGVAALLLLWLPDVQEVSPNLTARRIWSQLGNWFGVLMALALRAKVNKA